MDRKELLTSPTYWTTNIQMELYRQIESYMTTKNLNRVQLAQKLGCSKSYVSQLLSGDFEHKLSKFIELSLAIGKIPNITYTDVDEYIELDSQKVKSSVRIEVSSQVLKR